MMFQKMVENSPLPYRLAKFNENRLAMVYISLKQVCKQLLPKFNRKLAFEATHLHS
jgi:hypothetical protein